MPQRRQYHSYSGSLSAWASDHRRPASLDELAGQLAEGDGPFTLRASGGSLHHQALGTGTIVETGGLPHAIAVRPHDRLTPDLVWPTVEVTGWTPWEAVVRATLRLAPPARWGDDALWSVDALRTSPPNDEGNRAFWLATTSDDAASDDAASDDAASADAVSPQAPTPDTTVALPRLIPYVLASAGRITVAGSLSADTMWRFSASFGKESASLAWLDLIVYDHQDGRRRPYLRRLYNPATALWSRATLPTAPPSDAGFDPKLITRAPSQADNDRQIRAVVGGFGLIGPIVRAKYLLLELDDSIDATRFALYPPAAEGPPGLFPTGADDERDDDELGQRLAEPGASEKGWGPAEWPDYPHTPEDELGEVGADLTSRALTWMWPTEGGLPLLTTLIEHRLDQVRKTPVEGGFRLPRKVGPETVACFGLFFPNHAAGMRGVIGNVAFGKPADDDPDPFRMWNRRYSYDNLKWVLLALPRFAAAGERLVWRRIFTPCIEATQRGAPLANPIPEFAFFMEGHWAALAARREPPETLQQTWVFPLDLDDPDGVAPVTAFLRDVRDLSTRRRSKDPDADKPVHIQICDVKCVPPSDALLGSSAADLAIAVTLGIEDGRAYHGAKRYGDPPAELKRLAKAYRDQAKIHLTKNLHVDPDDLRHMYGAAIEAFLAVKSDIDPDGIWRSSFSDLLTT